MDYRDFVEVIIAPTDTGLNVSFRAKKPCSLSNPDGSFVSLETGQEANWEYVDIHPKQKQGEQHEQAQNKDLR